MKKEIGQAAPLPEEQGIYFSFICKLRRYYTKNLNLKDIYFKSKKKRLSDKEIEKAKSIMDTLCN